MKGNNFIDSDFYCTQCGGKTINVWRRRGQEREAGHLKKLYCFKCNKEQNCVEIKQNNKNYCYQDFLLEFENHNFDEEGNRKRAFNIFKGAIYNEKANSNVRYTGKR